MSELSKNSKYGIGSLNTIPDGYSSLAKFETLNLNKSYPNNTVSLVRGILKKATRTTNSNKFSGISILVSDGQLTGGSHSADIDNSTNIRSNSRTPEPLFKIQLPHMGIGYTYENKNESAYPLNKTQHFDVINTYKKSINEFEKLHEPLKATRFSTDWLISPQGNKKNVSNWYVRGRNNLNNVGAALFRNTNSLNRKYTNTLEDRTAMNNTPTGASIPQYEVNMPIVKASIHQVRLPIHDQYMVADMELSPHSSVDISSFSNEP